MSDAPNHELKLSRAYYHLQEFQRQADDRYKIERQTITEPDPQSPGYFFVKINIDPPPLDPFGLLIGDCVQNLRSVLDHLALELAVSYAERQGKSIRQEDERVSQFPIIGNENRKGESACGLDIWNDWRNLRKIGGIDPLAQTEIQRLQPYHRGDQYRTHHLWILRELSNIDKHRLIHPVGHTALTLMFDTTFNRNVIDPFGPWGDVEFFPGVLKGETVIARLRLEPEDPSQQMEVDLRTRPDIVFDDSSPIVPGDFVIATLSQTYNFIVRGVIPPLQPFL